MKIYEVEAEITDEVCIADRHRSGNDYMGMDYIPGTTLWGAAAAATGIRPGEEPTHDFRKIFYSGEVIFSNLYPSEGPYRAHPIPLSARTKKSAPGFAYPGVDAILKDEKGTEVKPWGVVDLLMDEKPDYDPDWAPLKGWYFKEPKNSEEFKELRMMIRGHTDRSNKSGTAREGRLFTRRNIARGQKFLGSIRVLTSEAESLMEEFVKKYLGANPIYLPVGRQPGTISVNLTAVKEDTPYYLPKPALLGGYITVTCLSDAIILDHWLRPLPYISKKEVAGAVGIPENAVEGPYTHYSSIKETYSWNGAYSRARETELSISAGSAFLFLISWPDEIDDKEKINRLTHGQLKGIGLRTAEGFGEVRINDPFHQEYKRGNNNHE